MLQTEVIARIDRDDDYEMTIAPINRLVAAPFQGDFRKFGRLYENLMIYLRKSYGRSYRKQEERCEQAPPAKDFAP